MILQEMIYRKLQDKAFDERQKTLRLQWEKAKLEKLIADKKREQENSSVKE